MVIFSLTKKFLEKVLVKSCNNGSKETNSSYMKTVLYKSSKSTISMQNPPNAPTLKVCISELRWSLPTFLGIYSAYAIPTVDLSRLRANPKTLAGTAGFCISISLKIFKLPKIVNVGWFERYRHTKPCRSRRSFRIRS